MKALIRLSLIVGMLAAGANQAVAQDAAPVRVGGNVPQPLKLKHVDPVTPPIALQAHITGVTIMEITVGTDGHVTNATILRHVALLDQAALDAVKQWVYQPTLLNGVPVPIIMTVTVNFTEGAANGTVTTAGAPPVPSARPIPPPAPPTAPQPSAVTSAMPGMPAPPPPPPPAPSRSLPTIPRVMKMVKPVSPGSVSSATVTIEGSVDITGAVTDTTLVTGDAALGQLAADALREWKFWPALLNGQPTSARVGVDFYFGPDGAVRTAVRPLDPTGGASTVNVIKTTSSAPPAVEPVRVGGDVTAPMQLKRVNPAYPADAFTAHVTGIVIIEATIDADGNVSQAAVLRSIPMLDEAALNAVMQWKYRPTLLNGVAVPVIMTVTVNFTM